MKTTHDAVVGAKYLLARAIYHIHRDIDEKADKALRDHADRVEVVRRSIGQKFRWAR